MKLDHLSLSGSDCGRSRDWYVAKLGLEVEFEVAAGAPEGLGVIALQDDDGLTVFLEQTGRQIVGGQGSYTIQVEDVEAAH